MPSSPSRRPSSESSFTKQPARAVLGGGYLDSHAAKLVASCSCQGDGLRVATVRQKAFFTIEVGEPSLVDAEAVQFFVSIRGASHLLPPLGRRAAQQRPRLGTRSRAHLAAHCGRERAAG